MKTYTIVASDIHGDLNQFLQPLMLFLSDTSKYTLVYLGDYIDRGENNVYIYEILSKIIKHPKVHALFGNHEIYDQGVQDYLSHRSKHRHRGNAFIKTFMFDLFTNLPLDVVYYNQHTNILYSHSPLNRPLAKALQLKKSIESTYTYDVNSKTMEYKNIHGHDHKRTTMEFLKKFFNGNELNMISIDNDASYGMRLEVNAYTLTNNNWVKDVKSHVHFLVINDQDIRDFRVVNNGVAYGGDDDFNTKPFPEIKQKLMNACADDRLKELVKSISLDASYAHFRKCINSSNIGDLPLTLRKHYVYNIRNRCENGENNVYFHDIPFEFYQRAKAESSSPCQLLTTIVSEGYKPIYDIYWSHIAKDDPDVVVESMSGGGEISSRWINMVVVVLLTSVVGLAVILTYKSYVDSKKPIIGDK